MNKSQLARDFWRKIFDNNVIDLRNSDARNKAVSDFLENPANKKTWAKKDRRFFRLGFDFVCRERGFNSHKVGVKPIAQRSQTNTGSISMNVKTDEKKVQQEKPLHDITSKQLKETGQEATAQQIPQLLILPPKISARFLIRRLTYYTRVTLNVINYLLTKKDH